MSNVDMMYHLFGMVLSKKCKDCSNLERHMFYKCKCYGVTSSAATDWRLKYIACGLFNREYEGTPVIEIKKHMNRPKDDTQVKGQMELKL